MKTHIKKALLLACIIIFVIGNSVNVVSVKANDISIPIGEVPKVYEQQGYCIFEIRVSDGRTFTVLEIGDKGFEYIKQYSMYVEFKTNGINQCTYVDLNQDGIWDDTYNRGSYYFRYDQQVIAWYYSTSDVRDGANSLVFHQPHWMGHTQAVKGMTVSWMALAISSLADLTVLVVPFLALAVGFRMSYRLLLNSLQKS